MFHVKSNFRVGAPISQVPASWFNKVANFLNNLVPGYGLKLTKSTDGPSVIQLDPSVVPQAVTRQLGKPEEKTDTAEDDYTDGDTWEWNAGGDNGLIMDAYCKVENEDGWHYLSRCRMTISKDGLITKVEGLAGRREIQA